jgi:phenylacetate-CoA ligase
VPLVDVYSAQEVGYIALQCPENESIYHVQAESLYVEIVDEEGEPCREGEVGRILVTTLHNFAMPLIRYEIGDYAEVGKSCSCGRTLPVLSRVLGRKRNMLSLPNGEKKWPSLGASIWASELPIIKQFQFVQKSLDRIEAHLVSDRQLNQEEESFFIGVLQDELRYPFTIDIKYLENFVRNKGAKFEDFVSEID